MRNMAKRGNKKNKNRNRVKVQHKIGTAYQDDEELSKLLKEYGAKIKIVGSGGSGNNSVQRMFDVGIEGSETIAMNTDAQQLLSTNAARKLLLGQKLTQGLGAGSDPDIGENAARESENEIAAALNNTDLVFLTCGLGGGTGTGSLPVVAEIAKDMGCLTIAVVTLPFTVEGRRRMDNALEGLQKLRKYADTVVIIPNDKLLEVAPDLPISSAFKVADEILTNAVKGITDLIVKPGLVNLDFADLRTVLNRCGPAMIGLGESEQTSTSESRALDAVENALTSPLLDIDISNATRALVNVSGGSEMTLKEAEMIVEAVASKIHPNAHIIWGAMVNETKSDQNIQAMVVVGGGKIPYLDILNTEKNRQDQGGGPLDLGIDYVD